MTTVESGTISLPVEKCSDATSGYRRFLEEMGGLATRAAINRMARIMRTDNTGSRSNAKGRFRSSLIGGCERRQLYSFLGAPQNTTNLDAVTVGTWAHYRWQTAGLSEGFLTDVEVKAGARIYNARYGGSADGIMADGSLFEFKNVREYSFDRRAKAPGLDHVEQMTVYMGLLGISQGHLVYEAMSSQKTVEWLIPYDDDLYWKVINRTLRIKGDWMHDGTRPDMHPLCTDKHWMRTGCAFRVTCLTDRMEEDGGLLDLQG